LFDGLPRTHDAHAEGITTVLKLPKNNFDEMLQENSAWYPYFMALLCQRLRATFMLIDETGCLSLKGQLCKRLLLMQQGLELQNSPQQNYELIVSQDMLAQLINSTRQTVNRILQALQADKVIQLKYGKLVILNTAKLEVLSQI
jgi:CRP-like cAMP-binding protein